MHAHLGWTVMVYNIAKTLPNFINPFWMLPLLGILGLKSKDLIGFTSVQFLIHFPIVIVLTVCLMTTQSSQLYENNCLLLQVANSYYVLMRKRVLYE
jgi:hypothetical protein